MKVRVAMKRAGDAGRLNVRFMVYADELNLLKAAPHPTPWLYGERLRMGRCRLQAQQHQAAQGSAGNERFEAHGEATGIHRVEAVNVLVGIDA